MREHQLTLSYGKVYVVDEGPLDAPPLLMVHGIPGTTKDFKHLASCLLETQRFRLVRLDLPGFGQSEPGRWQNFSVKKLSLLVKEVIDALSLKDTILVGHSFGGAVCFVAATQVSNISSVCLINGPGIRRHRGITMPPFLYRVLILGMRFALTRRMVLKLMRRIYERIGFLKFLDAKPQELLTHLKWYAKINFGEIRTAAADVQVPLLSISNADDPLIESEISFELIRAINRKVRLSHIHLAAGGHRIGPGKAKIICDYLAKQ